MARRSVRRLLVSSALLVAALFAAPPAGAQYFGRNQVQWQRFDFHVLRTEHFDIHFYPADNRAAQDAARMAERWYARLSAFFGHRFTERKPIILYGNVPEFHQTTLSGGIIGEGVGGFTEPLRDRLVMPLAGTYADTDHVLGHEMVHVFQFDMAAAQVHRQRGGSLERMPLWLIEGLAEYLSLGSVDPNTAMWLRDAVIRDDLPTYKDLNRDPRYFPYRWGEAFYAYVGGRWGDPAVAAFFRRAMQSSVEQAARSVLGTDLDEVFAAWHASIRQTYAESNAATTAGTGNARRIGGNARFDVAPVISPDGERIAFLSSRSLFAIELYLADTDTGRVGRPLVTESQDAHFDALRFIDSAGAWSPDSRQFAFVVFTRGQNGIAIVDADRRRIVRRLAMGDVGEITSLAWSPDGRTIALSGAARGVTDLYLVDVGSGAITRLTDDLHADLHPAWSPDGRTLAFASDRGAGTDFGSLTFAPLQIALMDVASRRVSTLPVFAGARHITPQFAPDGRALYFVGNPDGVPNVYRVALTDGAPGAVHKVTNLLTGVAGITPNSPPLTVARGTGRLVFTVFDDSRYRLYTLPAEQASGVAVETTVTAPERTGSEASPQAPTEAGTEAGLAKLPPLADTGTDQVDRYLDDPLTGLPESRRYAPAPYTPRLGMAAIGPPVVGVAAGAFGTSLGGGATAYFTDMLGYHQLGVTVQGETGNSAYGGSTFGASATYLNRARRLNWGIVGAHVPFVSISSAVGRGVVETPEGPVVADIVQQLRERVTVDQGGLIAAWPFSMTRRVEGSVTYSRYRFDNELRTVTFGPGGGRLTDDVRDLESPSYTLTEGAVAYVADTSNFGFTSPLRGTRFRAEAGATTGTFAFRTALLDYRRYMFRNPVSLAFRALHFGRYGGDAEDPRLTPLYVGRDYLVRGYDVAFDPAQCTADGSAPTGNTCPVYDRLVGSRMAVVNIELRTQLFGTEELGIFNNPYFPLELAAFVDAGTAWSSGSTPTLRFSRTSNERIPVVSAGVTARVLLGGVLPLEVYYARPFQLPNEGWTWGLVIAPGW